MIWPRTRPRRRALASWTALLALSSLAVLPERSLIDWRHDLSLLDVTRRKLAAYALRSAPDAEVDASLVALAALRHKDDPELEAIVRRSIDLLVARVAERTMRREEAAGRPFGQEVGELLEGPQAELGEVLLQGLLLHSQPELREQGLAVLEWLGPVRVEDVEQVALRTRDDDVLVRRAALRALHRIEPEGQELFDAALLATRDGDGSVRRLAWQALAESPHLRERARDPARVLPLAEALEAALEQAQPDELEALPDAVREALRQSIADRDRAPAGG